MPSHPVPTLLVPSPPGPLRDRPTASAPRHWAPAGTPDRLPCPRPREGLAEPCSLCRARTQDVGPRAQDRGQPEAQNIPGQVPPRSPGSYARSGVRLRGAGTERPAPRPRLESRCPGSKPSSSTDPGPKAQCPLIPNSLSRRREERQRSETAPSPEGQPDASPGARGAPLRSSHARAHTPAGTRALAPEPHWSASRGRSPHRAPRAAHGT